MERRVSVMLFLHLGVFLHQLWCFECIQSYPVRLTGGSNVYRGQIELLQCSTNTGCSWTTVCTSGWSTTEAIVVCRQLGLYTGSTPTASGNYSNSGHGSSYAASISCANSSCGALRYCNVTFTTCPSTSRATVICTSPPQISVPSEFSSPSVTSTYYISTTLQWTSSSATKYFISCSNGYNSHTYTLTNITLSDLAPYTSYTCCISGIDSQSVVGSSQRLTFNTSQSTPRIAPPNLRYMMLQSRSVTLQWDALSQVERAGRVNTYSVNVQGRIGSQNSTVTILNATNTTLYVSSLCPHSVYNISVRACTNNMCGPNSSVIQVQTPEDAPSIVNNLMCSAASPTQVYITWGQPSQANGVIRYYEIILDDINTRENVTKLVNSQITSTTIDKLLPNHNYSCSVAAHTVVRGNLTSVARITLPHFSGSEHFSCIALSSNTLQVRLRQQSMLEQNGPIDVYLVSIWTVHTDEVVYSNKTQFVTQNTLLVNSLALYNNYECSVSAYSQYGVGVFGVVPVWIPETAQFGPPTSLEYTSITKTSFALRWGQPHVKSNYNLHFVHYIVRVYSNETNDNTQIRDQNITKKYYQVHSLHPGYYYRIELSALANIQGPTSIHYVQTQEDAPSGAPQNLLSFNVTSSSFMLSWTKPPFETQNGRIIGYAINVTDNNAFKKSLQTDTQNESILVTAVKESTTYFVSVAAKTKVGEGPYSKPISIKTKSNISGSVLLITISSLCVIFLLCFGLLLCLCLRKKIGILCKKRSRKAELCQLDSNVNTLPPRSSSDNYEYSTLHTLKEDKPPAVPPKTYLFDEAEISSTKSLPDSEEEVENVADDNCSVGSDSLYDMKLETVDHKELPERQSTIKPIQTNDGKTQSPSFKGPGAKCSPAGHLKKKDAVGLKERGESNYQKMDIKTFNLPSRYDNIDMLKRKDSNSGGNEGRNKGHHQHTTAGSQYEPLQLKTMKRPNEYKQVTLPRSEI